MVKGVEATVFTATDRPTAAGRHRSQISASARLPDVSTPPHTVTIPSNVPRFSTASMGVMC